MCPNKCTYILNINIFIGIEVFGHFQAIEYFSIGYKLVCLLGVLSVERRSPVIDETGFVHYHQAFYVVELKTTPNPPSPCDIREPVTTSSCRTRNLHIKGVCIFVYLNSIEGTHIDHDPLTGLRLALGRVAEAPGCHCQARSRAHLPYMSYETFLGWRTANGWWWNWWPKSSAANSFPSKVYVYMRLRQKTKGFVFVCGIVVGEWSNNGRNFIRVELAKFGGARTRSFDCGHRFQLGSVDQLPARFSCLISSLFLEGQTINNQICQDEKGCNPLSNICLDLLEIALSHCYSRIVYEIFTSYGSSRSHMEFLEL
ncbi:serine/threonine-protein phosphatase 2A activator1 [Striga asiatica]|uniref:Serine/threonine-protein phosphatase 2A activator1 n=1 Tax=Striga asiatica TaxID=4170 RepID=A0A5A7P573_STRAF|nr:serine/threonine-protein phosphatase 2A activator1 [Striga asiatica]